MNFVVRNDLQNVSRLGLLLLCRCSVWEDRGGAPAREKDTSPTVATKTQPGIPTPVLTRIGVSCFATLHHFPGTLELVDRAVERYSIDLRVAPAAESLEAFEALHDCGFSSSGDAPLTTRLERGEHERPGDDAGWTDWNVAFTEQDSASLNKEKRSR